MQLWLMAPCNNGDSSSSEPETELGVATALLDRLRCPAGSELSRKRYVVVFNEFSVSKMLYYASTMLNAFGFYYAQWHYPPRPIQHSILQSHVTWGNLFHM